MTLHLSLKSKINNLNSVQLQLCFELALPLIIQVPISNRMEKSLEAPLSSISIERTPPQTLQRDQKSPNSGNDGRKTGTPDLLKVPKAFKYPERYRSPTDSMMSPVSKGLLARSRKAGVLLPPAKTPPKILDPCFQDVGLSQV